VVVVGGFYVRRWYLDQKLSRARYVFPLDYSKLPVEGENAFWLGRVAETDRRAWFDPDDLVTHVLVAGSTGSGKSVSASVMVEEALLHKVPVVIFDPTAQWTGFVRPCKDRNLLDKYKDFGMVEDDAKPFKGMIFEVTDPHLKIDFKKFMNPGEVTVFTLNRLKPGEYDQAVQAIVSTIFEQGWEESPSLRLLLVFDEVHRLLEKYGGSGGYVSLEKACREFRKWGIGLIMASQVSTDFKEAVQGNILTEIQMNTKSIEDIKKMEEKYGAEFARRISRQAVGVGMVQHPKYNDGKPWFVNFRPTMHSPHKILDAELDAYKKFASQLEGIEAAIAALKASGYF
jgi:Helicase HerA, central domain